MSLKEAEFLEIVQQYCLMPLSKGEGLYRHLHFRHPETRIGYFDVITVPGHLIYTGDLGTFMFSRAHADMLNLFRKPEGIDLPEGQTLHINPMVWSAYLSASHAQDGDVEGFEEFSADKFKAYIEACMDECGAPDVVREAVQRDILSPESLHSEESAIQAAADFNSGMTFPDADDQDYYDFTYRYLFACYALTWAVDFFDEVTAQLAKDQADAQAATQAETTTVAEAATPVVTE